VPEVPIYREPRNIVGQRVEALRAQSFICSGELVSSANALFIKVAGTWYRVVLDYGTVHWTKQEQEQEPLAWEVPENDLSYPHRDIGTEFGLIDTELAALHTREENGQLRVEFTFSNGRRLVFFNRDDSNSYHAASQVTPLSD
jgi:hypothetical protein